MHGFTTRFPIGCILPYRNSQKPLLSKREVKKRRVSSKEIERRISNIMSSLSFIWLFHRVAESHHWKEQDLHLVLAKIFRIEAFEPFLDFVWVQLLFVESNVTAVLNHFLGDKDRSIRA